MNTQEEQLLVARNAALEKELAEKNRRLEIETALERVRARAMAMHHSEELNDVLSVLLGQFDILGIHPVKAVLSLFNGEKNTFTFRTTVDVKRLAEPETWPAVSASLYSRG